LNAPGCAPEAREARVAHDLRDSRFAGLSAERESDLLGTRGGRTDHRRGGVEDPADRVQVVFEPIVRERLDDHERAAGRQRVAHVSRCTDRISHVVQTVEHCDQVVPPAFRSRLEANTEETPPSRGSARSIDGPW
jgi:hypothetical protein